MFGPGRGPDGEDGSVAAGGAASGPGRGGVSRGPGPAWLGMTGDTQGDTDAFQAKRLPPGVPVPKTWERIGTSRGAPEVRPIRGGGAGGAADDGPGAAAWQRRLAPHHREAVRRYFTDEGQRGQR